MDRVDLPGVLVGAGALIAQALGTTVRLQVGSTVVVGRVTTVGFDPDGYWVEVTEPWAPGHLSPLARKVPVTVEVMADIVRGGLLS